MKLHIDIFEEKLAELEYFKNENLNIKEKLKDYNQIKSENIALTNKLKQSEDNLQKMKIKAIELEEKTKYVKIPNENIPISVSEYKTNFFNFINFRNRILLRNSKL